LIDFFCSWKFAFAVILNEQVRPRLAYYKWENIRENLYRRREYQTLYFKELTGEASKQEKQRAQVRQHRHQFFYDLLFVHVLGIRETNRSFQFAFGSTNRYT